MDKYSIRPANKSDFPEIKALIRKVRINPTRLEWKRFTVAISKDRVIACCQLKPVPGGLIELASLAVHPSFRHRGIGRELIEILIKKAPRPIYLTCRSRLGALYEKFGFQALQGDEIPPYYQRLKHLVGIFLELTGRDETMLVMRLR